MSGRSRSEKPRNMLLAANLTRIMDDRGVNNTMLATGLGVSRQAVHQWRSGASYPTKHIISAICVFLDCKLRDLTRKSKPKPAAAAGDFILLRTWAALNDVPITHARDLVTYGFITGVTRTAYTINVPKDAPLPEDSRALVRMAKCRPPWVPTFHARFPLLLKTSGITTSALSAKLNVTAGAVLHWRHGRNYPERERLPHIARVLNVTVMDLAGTV